MIGCCRCATVAAHSLSALRPPHSSHPTGLAQRLPPLSLPYHRQLCPRRDPFYRLPSRPSPHSLLRSSLQPDDASTAPSNVRGDTPLAGTVWLLTLDLGRERNTWMPPQWAASGLRIEVPMLVALRDGGVAEVVRLGAFLPWSAKDRGSWEVDGPVTGGTLRLLLPMGALVRGDLSLPEGDLYVAIPAWGRVLSRDKGVVTVLQQRWVVRRERRIVGRVFAREAEEGEDTVVPPCSSRGGGSYEGRTYS